MDNPRRILVVADDRERPGAVVPHLARNPEIELRVVRLRVGDFEVDERFVVERKTLHDFALSVSDGRLFTQANALTNCGRSPLILLEGTSADIKGIGLGRPAMLGALLTITVFYGVPLLRSRDPEESSRMLWYLGKQSRRYAAGGIRRPGRRPTGKLQNQLYVLQGLPGIGPERAQLMLDRFGSIQGAVNASAQDLASLAGIGIKTAARIRAVLE